MAYLATVQWADAVPNLLIGLREGLEAGLVVSILLAALHKTNASLAAAGATDASPVDPNSTSTAGRPLSSTPVWLGVLGAVMVSGSFAAVLTYSTDALSSTAQQAVGGVLSVLAVALVTGMVFWMRRTARLLSAQLRGEVARAVALGAGALTITVFLAVAREGLETTLFLWTAVKASGETVAPLMGAAIGLAAAVVACWLLYRQAVRFNLGVFFNRTAIALIVIAAGVLAYGLRDLQEAGWLPGQSWIAFDLSAHIDPNSWWVSIITGVTELSPRMTVLQVVAWLVYLAVVIPAFVNAGRSPAPVAGRTEPAAATTVNPAPAVQPAVVGRWERLISRRAWPVAGVLVLVPALLAGLVIAALPASAASTTTAVTVAGGACAPEWSSGRAGTQTFAITNRTSKAGEINLVDAAGAIVAEIETLGPATTATMSATLSPGQYSFLCLMSGGTLRGTPVQVSGARQAAPLAVKRVTEDELTAANTDYQHYAAAQLVVLARDVATLRGALAAGDLAAAKTDWLAAQLDWERVGASYDSFGDNGQAVDGLPDGLPNGVSDRDFTGLHRIEYGLYHGQTAAQLLPVADQLVTDVATVQQKLTTDDEAGDPTNLPLRVHEVLEDALRDHLSGLDDQGSGTAYALTWADTQATQAVLGQTAALITDRDPHLVATVTGQLTALQAALLATKVDGQWQPPAAVPLAGRQRVNAAIGTLLESLSIVPDLLELPPGH